MMCLLTKKQKFPKKVRKIWKLVSPRSKLQIAFIAAESLIIGIFLFNFNIFKNVMQKGFLEQVSKELTLMDWSYDIKINQMSFGFASKIHSIGILEILKAQNIADFASVKEELVSETLNRNIEYATLLDSSGKILVNANSNRTGEKWDPANLISMILNNPTVGQLQYSAIVQFSELHQEKIPMHREICSVDQPVSLTHPYDTQSAALIRYVATPILSNETSLLGIIVAGDIVNGKNSITFRVVDAYNQGFAGLYMLTEEGDISTCASNYLHDIPSSDFKGNSVKIDPTPLSFIQEVLFENGLSTFTTRYNSWSFAAKKLKNTISDGTSQTVTDVQAAFVRGIHDGDSVIYKEILKENITYLCCVLATDFAMFVLLLVLFISPLERLARHLKKRKSVLQNGDLMKDTFKMLQNRKKHIFLVITPTHIAKSVILSVLMILSLKGGLRSSKGETTFAAMGVQEVMYKLKIDQMSLGSAGLAENAALHEALELPNNTDLLEVVSEALSAEILTRKIEFAILVDLANTIVVNPQMQSNASGTFFDPQGLSSKTINSGFQHKISCVLSYEEFLQYQLPILQEKNDIFLSDSALNPYYSRSPCLVRFTSFPVYISNTYEKAGGALIYGDIINGKTIICERVLAVMTGGYCGIYIHENEELIIASSVFQGDGSISETIVDYDIPNKDFLKQMITEDGQKTVVHKLMGVDYIFAISAIPKDTYISEYGEFEMARDEEIAFVVYASVLETDRWIWLWFGLSVQVFGIFLSGLLSAGLTYFAFRPVKKLLVVAQRMGFLKEHNAQVIQVKGSSSQSPASSQSKRGRQVKYGGNGYCGHASTHRSSAHSENMPQLSPPRMLEQVEEHSDEEGSLTDITSCSFSFGERKNDDKLLKQT